MSKLWKALGNALGGQDLEKDGRSALEQNPNPEPAKHQRSIASLFGFGGSRQNIISQSPSASPYMQVDNGRAIVTPFPTPRLRRARSGLLQVAGSLKKTASWLQDNGVFATASERPLNKRPPIAQFSTLSHRSRNRHSVWSFSTNISGTGRLRGGTMADDIPDRVSSPVAIPNTKQTGTYHEVFDLPQINVEPLGEIPLVATARPSPEVHIDSHFPNLPLSPKKERISVNIVDPLLTPMPGTNLPLNDPFANADTSLWDKGHEPVTTTSSRRSSTAASESSVKPSNGKNIKEEARLSISKIHDTDCQNVAAKKGNRPLLDRFPDLEDKLKESELSFKAPLILPDFHDSAFFDARYAKGVPLDASNRSMGKRPTLLSSDAACENLSEQSENDHEPRMEPYEMFRQRHLDRDRRYYEIMNSSRRSLFAGASLESLAPRSQISLESRPRSCLSNFSSKSSWAVDPEGVPSLKEQSSAQKRLGFQNSSASNSHAWYGDSVTKVTDSGAEGSNVNVDEIPESAKASHGSLGSCKAPKAQKIGSDIGEEGGLRDLKGSNQPCVKKRPEYTSRLSTVLNASHEPENTFQRLSRTFQPGADSGDESDSPCEVPLGFNLPGSSLKGADEDEESKRFVPKSQEAAHHFGKAGSGMPNGGKLISEDTSYDSGVVMLES